MSRNMKRANQDFFLKIQSILDEDLTQQISASARYIATDEKDKFWLQYVEVKYSFRISRNAFALLLYLKNDNYLCPVNIGAIDESLPPCLTVTPVNAGLITVLGAKGYLRQYRIMRNPQKCDII